MALIEAIAIVVALLFLIICWCVTTKIPSLKEWPVFGMLPSLLINAYRIHEFFYDLLKPNKNTVEVKGPWFSNMGFILTSDPENIHYILSTKSVNFNKGTSFKENFDVLGDGLLAADNESWKMQRKLIHSLFRQTEFLRLVETTSQQKLEMGLFKILDQASDNKQVVEIQDLFHRFTLDITCTFLLGLDLNSLTLDLPEVPFAKAIGDMGEVILRRHLLPKSMWKLQKWLQIGIEKRGIDAYKTIDSFLYQQISHKQEQIKMSIQNGTAKEEGFDLISNFMKEDFAADCKNMKKIFLRDSVMSILSAGRDTTATALTWFFYLVSINPLVESKIREEIQVKFQMSARDPWGFPSYHKLNELIYLHAVLCETLRLHPPVPSNHKSSIDSDILPSGHRVNKETKVIMSIYTMGRMEEIWGADCLEFRPERWISENKVIIDIPSFKYNVFGAGPRTCVGKDLALREMKAVAAAVIWSYTIRVIKDHPVIPASAVALKMKYGLKIKVAKKLSNENGYQF